MENEPIRRKLRRLSNIPIIEPEPVVEKDSESSPKGSFIATSSESETSQQELLQKKPKKSKPVKNNAPKLLKFNKLIDIKTIIDEYSVAEFEYLRDMPLEISKNGAKAKKTSFISKVKTKPQDKSSYSLAKSVLTNTDERDSLIVNAPKKIEGFTVKQQSSDPRGIFRNNLRNVINERKTTHIGKDNIFNKTSTDLTAKDEIIERNEGFSVKSSAAPLETPEISEKVLIPNVKTEKKHRSYPSTSASSPIYMRKEESTAKDLMENEADDTSEEVYNGSLDSDEDFHDKDLEDLINNQDLYENSEITYSKHIKDMLAKEVSDLNKVVNADFKRKNTEPMWQEEKVLKIQSFPEPLPAKSNVFSKPGEDSDEEDRYKNLCISRDIKLLRKVHNSPILLDEKSADYLKLITKPEITHSFKTLLNTTYSNSIHLPSTSSRQAAYSKKKLLEKPEILQSAYPVPHKSKLLTFLRK